MKFDQILKYIIFKINWNFISFFINNFFFIKFYWKNFIYADSYWFLYNNKKLTFELIYVYK